MGSKGLIFLILLLIANSAAQEWTGTDEKAEDLIKEINPDYEPWLFPLWEPPSGEIESLLFSVQAALGALLIGYILGYYKAKHARNA